LQNKLLAGLSWQFTDEPYQSKATFSDAVRARQVRIFGKDTWHPEEVLWDKPKLDLLLVRDWEYPPDNEVLFSLTSENSKNFTAVDLAFQLHNFLAQYHLSDYVFLEGLVWNPDNGRYVIHLGS
jgi:hypothetical protein